MPTVRREHLLHSPTGVVPYVAHTNASAPPYVFESIVPQPNKMAMKPTPLATTTVYAKTTIWRQSHPWSLPHNAHIVVEKLSLDEQPNNLDDAKHDYENARHLLLSEGDALDESSNLMG